MFNRYSRFASSCLAGALLVALPAAHAALDVSAATTGISDASTAAVSVLGAMIAVGAIVWGLRKVIGFLGR